MGRRNAAVLVVLWTTAEAARAGVGKEARSRSMATTMIRTRLGGRSCRPRSLLQDMYDGRVLV